MGLSRGLGETRSSTGRRTARNLPAAFLTPALRSLGDTMWDPSQAAQHPVPRGDPTPLLPTWDPDFSGAGAGGEPRRCTELGMTSRRQTGRIYTRGCWGPRQHTDGTEARSSGAMRRSHGSEEAGDSHALVALAPSLGPSHNLAGAVLAAMFRQSPPSSRHSHVLRMATPLPTPGHKRRRGAGDRVVAWSASEADAPPRTAHSSCEQEPTGGRLSGLVPPAPDASAAPGLLGTCRPPWAWGRALKGPAPAQALGVAWSFRQTLAGARLGRYRKPGRLLLLREAGPESGCGAQTEGSSTGERSGVGGRLAGDTGRLQLHACCRVACGLR
ncbi:uncharacterized protein [Vicugna pacos]|uniref:Uncharacterized protein n=1 Tax=Vicugna pacos TaxID=30538 RepID=A0ABM5BT45_VICPA